MFTQIFHKTKSENTSAKTQVKFFWDFRKELEKTMTELEVILTAELEKLFTIDSIISGNNDIKIRIRDEAEWTEKRISAILRYHHDDEKYGNVHIEILVAELSERNKSLFLGKYLITDRKSIIKNILEASISAMRARL